jgi:chitin synthase
MSEAGSLYQPAPTRPSTNYLDMSVPLTGSPDQLGDPSNMVFERAVNDLLRGVDLNSVTKREIRRRLEEQFGMDLTSCKATINGTIDRALLSYAW